MKLKELLFVYAACLTLALEGKVTVDSIYIDRRWGDQENGRFVNPILNADFSDPDVIRVKDKYYMVASDFHFIGMQVMESDDLVNWKIASQVYNKFDFPKWNTNERYGGGAWAPAIRYHKGLFWVYFCSPHEGLFMANAKSVKGPWSPLLNVQHVEGWEDPCPLWDDDGQAYLGRSQLGGGPIILHKMSADGTKLLDEGQVIYEGPVAEGTKLHKQNGYYYLSIPEGGVSTGWQTVARSKNIYGPYEKKIVLEKGITNINGPHQGAFVDTPDGEWWFYHFQSTEPLGRVVHLQPVVWKDGWPVIGADYDGNGIGEPVKEWSMPQVRKKSSRHLPLGSDDFGGAKLKPQWQFNHNPVNENWSLIERPGYFRIKALKADNLRNSKLMLSQKCMGYSGTMTTEVDCSAIEEGQRIGLFCTGNEYNAVGVTRDKGSNYIYYESNGKIEKIIDVSASILYFKASYDIKANDHQLYYSVDNKMFNTVGQPYQLHSSDWKGTRVGIFSYNILSDGGIADFNWVDYKIDNIK